MMTLNALNLIMKFMSSQFLFKGSLMSGLPVRQIVFILFSLCVLSCATKPENKPPKAAFHFVPQSGTVETNFVFDATNSSDPEDESSSLQIRWDWDSDGVWDTSWGDLELIEHQFSQQGIQAVTLEVKDSGGNTDTFDRTVAVGNRPFARFGITPLIGTIDSVFTFDASKSLNPGWEESALLLRWDWECDGEWDIAWSNERIQSHQYARDGIFNVALEVKNSESVTDTIISQVYVCPPDSRPNVSFTATPDSGSYTLPFQFDASGSFDPQGPTRILKFRWDWESDGIWDTEWNQRKTVSHIYGEKGIYTVGLIASNADGYVDSTSNNVVAMNTPPTAVFTITPDSGWPYTLFSFKASGSRDSEDLSEQLIMRWDWESDGNWDTNWSTEKSFNHQFDSTGTFTTTLEVMDTEQLSSTTTRQVQVAENTPPLALFTVTPDSGITTINFEFDGSPSVDAETPGMLLEVRWDWENDGVWDTDWSTTKLISHRFNTVGTHWVVIAVKDEGQLIGTSSKSVSVANAPPHANCTINYVTGTVHTFFNFDASASSDPETPVEQLEVRWDFEYDGIWDIDWQTEKVASHQYLLPGIYELHLAVRDPEGLEDTATYTIEVQTAVEGQPELVWNIYVGGQIYSSPALAPDGTVYIGAGKDLCAINPEGTIKWHFPTQSYVNSSPAIAEDGTVYVGSRDGYLYAINPDGTENWSYDIGKNNLWHSSPAIAFDGTIYIGAMDGYLWAFNPDGSYKWRCELGGPIESSSPSIDANGIIYIASINGQLYAVNPDGTLHWEFNIGVPSNCSPAIADDGTIYISSTWGLTAVDPQGGYLWGYEIGSSGASHPVIGTDGTVYTRGFNFMALDPDNANLKWAYTGNSSNFSTAAAIGSDGNIYVGCTDSHLYAFNASGTLLWKYKNGWQGIWSSPALSSDGVLYFGYSSGYVLAIHTNMTGLASSGWPKFRGNNRNTGRK